MSDKFALARYFVETQPQAAARVLEELAPASASSFIDAVPDADSTNLLASMLPYHAAKCLSFLSPDAAAKYLASFEARSAANILRQIDVYKRKAILEHLPQHVSARITIILNYSKTVVGAWIDPMAFAIPPDCTLGEAKSRLKNEDYTDHHRIYVVDDTGAPLGYVKLISLIQEDENSPVRDHLCPMGGALRANTSLDIAINDTGWIESDRLPVLDRRGSFLGMVRLADLRAAAAPRSRADSASAVSETFLDLAEYCYLGLADVVTTSLATDGSTRRDGGSQ